jgi:DNA-binding CsgD family transcriptional regulator
MAWRVRALVALRRGSTPEAEEHLNAIEERFPRDSSRPWWPMRFLLRAQVAYAKEGAKAAIEALAEIWASAGARREVILEDASAAACCVRWAMEADRPDIAKMVINTAKTLCAGNEKVRALRVGMEHAQGLLLGDAEALAEASRSYPDPWARARAAEDLARLFLARDDRDSAIAELEKALDGYSAIGGEGDVARVRADLRRLGVRRRHWKHAKRPVSGWDSLTGAEQRVAELVAKGLTNRQVANQLYVSPHTVGFHLRQVYRKLHLRSRQELIRYKA